MKHAVLGCLVSLCCLSNALANSFTVITLPGATYNEVGIPLITELYQRIGIDIQTLEIPSSRQAFMLTNNRADAIIIAPPGFDTQNPNIVRLPIPLSHLSLRLFTGRDDLSWPLTENLTLGVLRGVIATDIQLDLPPNLNIIAVNNIEQMMRMADRQRLDIVILPYTQGLTTIDELKLQQVHVFGPEVANIPMYHYLNIRHQSLVAPLHQVMQQWQESGYLQDVHQQWRDKLEAKVYDRR